MILPPTLDTDLCLVLMKNIKHTKFVYCFKTLNQTLIEYLRFTYCYEKAHMKPMALAQ